MILQGVATMATNKLLHEELYRGSDQLAKLREVRVALCGAGALGSNLADNLARQGFTRLRVIDRDRVEAHNVGTQLYGESEVGLWKVDALRNRLFRAAGVEIESVRKELTAPTARQLLKDADVVIDTFDNSASRALVQTISRKTAIPACLHVGLFAEYGEIVWDSCYRVPRDVSGDVCEYPLARNIVLLAVAIASETLMAYVLDGHRRNWSVTLRDLAITPLDAPVAAS
jgi:molybdopterin/thiamine biosynthesis adenylyltransferase